MSNKKDIYEMKLHKQINIGENIEVMRVAGGWLYTLGYCEIRTIFVPYHNEFMGQK